VCPHPASKGDAAAGNQGCSLFFEPSSPDGRPSVAGSAIPLNSGDQLRTAIDAEAGTSTSRSGVLVLIAAADGRRGVHDRATLGAMADRGIPTAMIHVVAERGPRARRDCGWTHELAFTTAIGFAVGREWSAIRKVARETLTSVLQRGHLGLMLLPATPSRYERAAWQCGQGPNLAVM
jgi:hypothetical protein